MTRTEHIPLASYEEKQNPMTAYLVKDEKGYNELVFPAENGFKTVTFYLTGDGYRVGRATKEYVKMLKDEIEPTNGTKVTPVQMDKEHYTNYLFVGHNVGGSSGDVPTYISALLKEGRKATEQEIASRKLSEQITESPSIEYVKIVSANTLVESIV
jgi:hypothetical protein